MNARLQGFNYSLLTVVVFCVTARLSAASPDRRNEFGTPIIQNYTASDYGEEAQIFSIAQDRRGVMYFGLLRSIAEFDGQHWRLIPVPSTVVRGLTLIGVNRKFAL